MPDQATEAVDPFEQAMGLIANEEDSSDTDEEEQAQSASAAEEEEATDDTDAPEDEASEGKQSEKIRVEFAGQSFDVPDGTPPELVEAVKDVGRNLQADYTRKTQELSARERQAAEIVSQEMEAGRQQLQRAVEQTYAVIQAVGGLMDPVQLAQLAETDPAEWIKANARQQHLGTLISGLNQQADVVVQQAKQAEDRRIEAAKQEAWQRLQAEGINRDSLQTIWKDALETFPFLTNEKLNNVLDADSWLVLRDAIAYRKLQASKPAIQKKVADAPKLPEGKKPMTKEDRARLDSRKAVMRKSGASMRDLAAFIANNSR